MLRFNLLLFIYFFFNISIVGSENNPIIYITPYGSKDYNNTGNLQNQYLNLKKENIAINLSYDEDLGLTSIAQIDDKLLGTSYTGTIYEIILPDEKNYEKSIYNRPLITKNLPAMKFINENKYTIFTHGSGFYESLKKIRYYLGLLPFGTQK